MFGQSRNCVFIEYLFCFHLVYIVIVKKKSSATEDQLLHQKYYHEKVSRVTMINNKTKCLVVLCKPENIEALGKPLYLGPKSFIRTVTDSSKPHLPLSNFSLARGCHFLALFI